MMLKARAMGQSNEHTNHEDIVEFCLYVNIKTQKAKNPHVMGGPVQIKTIPKTTNQELASSFLKEKSFPFSSPQSLLY